MEGILSFPRILVGGVRGGVRVFVIALVLIYLLIGSFILYIVKASKCRVFLS